MPLALLPVLLAATLCWYMRCKQSGLALETSSVDAVQPSQVYKSVIQLLVGEVIGQTCRSS